MTRKHIEIFLYSSVFFIIAIGLFCLYKTVFNVFICSVIISAFSREFNIFKKYKWFLFICYSICYLTFSSFTVFINRDWISVFAFSYFLLDYPIYYFLNEISLRKFDRRITIVGGPGFNIKHDHSLIDVLYGIIGLILIIIYSLLISIM